MKKVTLHIDSRPEFLGQVLRVTENATGEIVSYGVETVEPGRVDRFVTASKIHFHNNETPDESQHVARYFSAILGSAQKIDVYGNQVKRRFPSTCAYAFDADAEPVVGADPPFNFDYALARAITPINIKTSHALLRAIKEMKREASDQDAAMEFPGITSQDAFVRVLKEKECADIDDDVVSVPWSELYRDKWYPVLREDGIVGVFRSMLHPENAYLLLETALPHFVCDQLLILVRENPLAWTWKQWATSQEMSNARNLAIEALVVIQQRALQTLHDVAGVDETLERVASEKMTTVTNTLRLAPGVTYDADISRAGDWHLKRTLLVRLVDATSGEVAYALVKNRDCGGGVFETVVPTTFIVKGFDTAEETVKNIFGKERRAIITVDVLREISA